MSWRSNKAFTCWLSATLHRIEYIKVNRKGKEKKKGDAWMFKENTRSSRGKNKGKTMLRVKYTLQYEETKNKSITLVSPKRESHKSPKVDKCQIGTSLFYFLFP